MTHALAWLALEELLAFSAFLMAWPVFGKWPDHGWGLSKALGILILATLAWMLGWIPGVAVTRSVSWTLAIAMLVVAALLLKARTAEPTRIAGASLRALIVVEALFVGTAAAFLLLRAARPEIAGGEKFMDFALLNAAIRSPSLPITDPWLSGFSLAYYHFGFVSWAVVTRMLATPPAIAYNLVVALIPAIVAAAAFSIALKLTDRVWPALASVSALIWLGNLAGAMQLRQLGGAYDLWPASRVIPGTINEFPFFTFLWADLHPHLLAMPNFLVFVALVLVLFERPAGRSSAGTDLLLGASAGIATATSPWDVCAFALLAGALVLTTAPRIGVRLVILGTTAFTAAALAIALPFLRSVQGAGVNVGLASSHSPAGAFLLVQAAWMCPAVLYLGVQSAALTRPRVIGAVSFAAAAILGVLLGFTTALLLVLAVLAWMALVRSRSAVLLLIAPAFTLLLAAELFFVDDIYGPDLARMNIVFKLHLHAILLLAVAAGATIDGTLRAVRFPLYQRLLGFALVPIALAAAVYPAGAVVSVLRSGQFATLDGTAYLGQAHPGDLAAIQYLIGLKGRPVIAEAVGSPYSYAARISANTGLPTILGWANHELVWRRDAGARAEIAVRTDAVRGLYEGDPLNAEGILQRYGVRYVVVGDFERQMYPAADFSKFERIGRKVLESHGTALFDVSGGAGR